MRRISTATVALVLLLAANVSAQGLSVSLRGGGGMPIGTFAEQSETELAAAAKAGFGYGADITLSLGRMLGIYGGLDRMNFECETSHCGQNNDYALSGVSAGLKLSPVRLGPVVPWVKGGLTFNELTGSYSRGTGLQDLSSDRAPGYEVGAGLDYSLFGMASLSPQVRYAGYSPRVRINGVNYSDQQDTSGVGYLIFDLGLGFRSPF